MTQPLTVRDICNQLRVHEGTVLAWIRNGELQAHNIGRAPGKKKPRYRVAPQALEDFLKSRETTKRPSQNRRRKQPAAGVKEYY